MHIQTKWRMGGAVAVVLAGGMAWYGVAHVNTAFSPGWLLAYWGFFLLLLLAVFYVVLLDIRFIRMRYAIEQRRIFQETLGDASFRKALRQSHGHSEADDTVRRHGDES